MQYCEGGAITDSLDKIKFRSEKIGMNVIRQVLGALSYLHSQSIVHRDIKLDNIVFLKKCQGNQVENMPIKIIDFGTATQMKYKIEHHSSIAGTISYMAPEVFKGVLTEKSDIWSTGIMIIKMMTGVNPFAGAS